MRAKPPMLAPVFGSETQARLLSSILLGGDELSLTELAEQTGTPYATAHREVARLLDAGILAERTAGRTRLLSARRPAHVAASRDSRGDYWPGGFLDPRTERHPEHRRRLSLRLLPRAHGRCRGAAAQRYRRHGDRHPRCRCGVQRV